MQTELNFQFLNTLSMSAEEFCSEDLPLGWEHSPAEDERDWLTNELEEFRAYTSPVEYVCKGKSDTTFLGRFTTDRLLDFYGMGRIFTILARGRCSPYEIRPPVLSAR